MHTITVLAGMNAPTVITLVILGLIVAGIIALVIYNKRKGKSSCGECRACPFGCKEREDEEKKK